MGRSSPLSCCGRKRPHGRGAGTAANVGSEGVSRISIPFQFDLDGDAPMRWTGLESRVNDDPTFRRFAAAASYRTLIRCGDDERLINVSSGRLDAVMTGPFVMPQCDFALSGAPEVWSRLVRRPVEPRDQDLFAYFRRREIALVGDTRMFYAHLLSLKLLLVHLGTGGA